MKNSNQRSEAKMNITELMIYIVPLLAIACLIGLLVYYSTLKSEYKNKTVSWQTYSLKSKSNIKGSFILGTGSIYETDYYYFFVKDAKFGGFHKEKLPVKETLLVEKDTIPSVVKNYYEKTTQTPYTIFKFLDTKKVDTLEYNSLIGRRRVPREVGYRYKLIVPPGTVTENVSYEAL